jgi:putative peptidoglycan lipid II flippase
VSSESQETISSASFISFAALGGAVVGFFLQQLVAYFFGAGADTDAFFMAQSTSELLSKLLLGGSVTAVFLPFFVERITRGERAAAWQLGLNVVHIMMALFVIVMILLAIFTRPFIGFIAPGFDQATADVTVFLLRLLLPSFLFLFLVDMATAMLHSLQHFAVPALLRIVAPLTSIISILLLVRTLGVYSLALGVVVGSVLQLALLFTTLQRKGFTYHFILAPRHPTIKRLLILLYPFIFSVLATQAAGIVYRILVSDLATGSLSALKFAEKITQLLAIMFLNSVTFVIFPLLSAKASSRDFVGMRETMAAAIRLIVFITLPIMVGVVTLRDPLIALIYQYGSFSAESAALTSVALLFLVIGLTTNGISSVFGHATLALQKTKAAVGVTVASQIIAIALFVLLVPVMGHAGLALGSSLVPLSITLFYFLYLKRSIPDLASVFFHRTYVKIIILTLIMGGLVVVTLVAMQPLSLPFAVGRFLTVIIPTLLGAAVYMVGAYLWKIPEMNDVLALIKQKRAKWANKKACRSILGA